MPAFLFSENVHRPFKMHKNGQEKIIKIRQNAILTFFK